MKEYDLISIGTGSAMTILDIIIQSNQKLKVAVIDKDEPGGICLTRGCIPSKILLYPAELIRTIIRAKEFGVKIEITSIDFKFVMERMRSLIQRDIGMIRQGLSNSNNIDYYPNVAEFVAPYIIRVNDVTITSKMIFLCTGSKPTVPPIEGLDKINYHTSDSILRLNQLPESIAIIGGGYIAAEYGHFFSTMGSKVTIIGRNPQFLPQEEQEISNLVKKELEKHMKIFTNHEVIEVEKISSNKAKIIAFERISKQKSVIESNEILIATGRSSNTDILHPDKGGIETDNKGWIIVNDYLETSQPNVWAFGDANGKFLFKHVANYESLIVYFNAILKRKVMVNYHAVPHAVFTYPEIASVGLREKEAIEKYGEKNVLIGIKRYQDTAKGEAMGVEDYFVKVLIENVSGKIIGAHIIGPSASILIQEIINSMYVKDGSAQPIFDGMHIHPALSEVVQGAFNELMSLEQYHHLIKDHYKLS